MPDKLQQATERAETAERLAADSAGRVFRFEIAVEKGLTAGLARRLVGSTREELEADADALLADLAADRRRQVPSFDGGARITTPDLDMNTNLRRLAGR